MISTAIKNTLIIRPAGGALASILRALVFCFLAAALNYFVQSGLSTILICASIFLGVWIGGQLALSRLKFAGSLVVHILAFIVLNALLYLLIALPASSETLLFLNQLREAWITFGFIAILFSFATWCFWHFSIEGTVEVLLISLASIQIFAAHRQFRFDTARILNDISWKFQIHPLLTLVILGSLLAGLITFYLAFTRQAISADLRLRKDQRSTLSTGKSPLFIFVSIACLISIVILTAYYIHQKNFKLLESTLQNGVSDESEEGLSPLGFHSALGASSQPAALVRLENDYEANPFSPMLYLRESALSEFDGKQMVLGNKNLNPDVPYISPGSRYKSEGFPEQYERQPVRQSIYLLSNHNLAFAIDYPLSIVAITTPKKTKKFKSAYKVYSMAPAYNLSELKNKPVGNPDWSDETREHFLKAHQDQRYHELAVSLTTDQDTPIAKAESIINYLNKNVIYTLTPGHEVEDDDDPTAAFLFGDKRGYCVHFAHATTYMLRSLGIPARVGTGYLTDLSQAKDGHILLRMSDRHAWAEVYVQGYGWVPFDTEPEQVEVHAETPVDAGLLEELMGLIEPGEEILPDDILEDEIQELGSERFVPVTFQDALAAFLLALTALFLWKFYLTFGWLLPANSKTKIARSARAFSLRLADLGVRRHAGETFSEFCERVTKSFGINSDSYSETYLALKYSSRHSLDSNDADKLAHQQLAKLKHYPIWQRIITFFNPITLFSRVQS